MKDWDKLKEEFEGSIRVKAVKLVTLKIEFKMLDSDFVKDYTTKAMNIVNQIRFASEEFPDQWVVEKLMVSVLDNVWIKNFCNRKSCDLKTFFVDDLISKLQAQHQRDAIQNSEHVEGSFKAKFKGKKLTTEVETESIKNLGKYGVIRKENFSPCWFCQKKKKSS